MRRTCRSDAKAGLSDPAVGSGTAVAHRIEGTSGITGSSGPRVHIDDPVWHLKQWGGSAEMRDTFRLITVEPDSARRGNTVGSPKGSERCRV